MRITGKLKEVIISIIPITAIVLLLHLTITPMPQEVLWQFLIGALFLVVGQALFLVGADISILPMGEMVGSTITRTRKVSIVLIFGFLFGLIVTVAEPDVQVLGNQVANVNPAIGKTLLIWCVSAGVGVFVAAALMRILTQFALHKALLICYGLVFAIAIFAPNDYLAVAFDSGGVTTGPITVPFILSLGMGVSAVHAGQKSADDSFGIIGLASLGPIISILILGMIFGESGAATTPEIAGIGVKHGVFMDFVDALPHMMGEVALALAPMGAIFIVFQVLFLKLPKREFGHMMVGLVITFAGLVLFLTGVNVGFSPAGSFLGQAAGGLSYNWILIPIGLLLGFFVVYTEPAVRVLNDQVEEVTSGYITRNTMLYALAAGVAISVALSMIRVLAGFSLWYYIVPGYVIALSLSRIVPPMFTAIAFDSGGVASGPMTATFMLPMLMGICAQVGGNILTDAFGVVAMVAMTPIITVQIVGLIYKVSAKEVEEQETLEAGEALLGDDIDFSGLDDEWAEPDYMAQQMEDEDGLAGIVEESENGS